MKKHFTIILFFLFTIKLAFAQPANDNCATPQIIVIPPSGNICINSTTINATSDGFNNTCDTGPAGNEVWFTYVATGAQNTITASPSGSPSAQQLVVTIQNTNCASGTYNVCGASPTAGGTATASYVYAPGTQVLISVETNGNNGNFQLCITSTTPPASAGGSCATATPICNPNNFSLNPLPNNINAFTPPCFFASLQQPVFYKFTVGSAGTCAWTATPQGAAEYDWALYDITAGCPGTVVRCNYHFANGIGAPIGMSTASGTACPISSAGGPISREICPALAVTAGSTYLLIIDNFSANNIGFNFVWGGTFQVAPTSSFTVSPATGCNSALTTITNTSAGAIGYNWTFGDGTSSVAANPPPHNYSSPGTFLISLITTAASGCTAVGSGSVVISPTPVLNPVGNVTVCAGAIVPPITFTTVPANTPVNWTRTNVNVGIPALSGSGTIANFAATNPTNAPLVSTITATPTLNGCPGTPVNFTVTVNPLPSVSNAGPNQNSVCGTIATLAGNAPASGSGTWTLVSGAGTITTPSSPTSGITGLGAGPNVFQWTISNGLCTNSTSQVTITGVAIPTVSNAGPNQNVCGPNATLAGNVPVIGTGTWSLVSGTGSITTPSAANSGITGLGLGNNVFEWSIANPGCPPSTSQVTLFGITPPTVTVPADFSLCSWTSTTASAFASNPAGATFTWTNSDPSIGLPASGSGNVPSFLATNLTANPLIGTITVTPTSTVPAACAGVNNTYNITVNPTPFLTITNPPAVCFPSTVDITAATVTAGSSNTGTLTYWNDALATASPITLAGAAAINTSGTYYIKSTLGNCTVILPVVVTISPSPTLVVTNPAAVCSPNTVDITDPAVTLGSTGAGATLSYWNDALAIASPILPFVASNISTSGTYYIKSSIGNCFDIQPVVVTINQTPTLTAPANVTVCDGVNVPATALTTVPANTLCNWTNSNTAIGLAASGNGVNSIPSFIATNSTGSPISATITVTVILNGCSSFQTYTITVNPVPSASNAGPNQTICGTTATLAGNNPAIGTGTWSVISGSGTITSASLFNSGITSLGAGANVFEWTISNGLCTSSSSQVTITGVTPPTVPNAGPNQNICGTITTLAGNSPGTGTGTWSLVSGAGSITTPAAANSGVSGLGLGNNVFEWSIANPGCTPSTSQVTIFVVTPPTVVLPANISICSGGATVATNFISAPAGASFTWTNSDPSIGLPISGSGNVPSFTATNATANPITATITVSPTSTSPAACAGTNNNYTITVNPTPSLIITPPAAVCAPGTVDITDPNVTTGSTSGTTLGYFTDAAATATLATPAAVSASGTYYIKSTVNGTGCYVVQPVTVTINPSPVLAITNPPTVCFPATVDITALSVTTGSTGGGVLSYWTDAAATNSLASPTTVNASGTYYIKSTIGVGGCFDINPVTVTINPFPVAGLSGVSSPGCAPFCVSPTDASVPVVAIGSWLWDFGDGITSTAQNPPPHCYISGGTYTISLKVTENGCDNTAYSTPVTVFQTPLAVFDAPQTISIANSTVHFNDNSTGATSWSWNFDDTTSTFKDTSSLQNPVHAYSKVGNYCVTLIAGNAGLCFDTTKLCLEIAPLFSYYIPNAFSPNADGINDLFYGKGEQIEQFEMTIYDRWGNLVFYTNDLLKPYWNGALNGDGLPAQEDTYVYIINIIDNLKETHKYIGSTTLVR